MDEAWKMRTHIGKSEANAFLDLEGAGAPGWVSMYSCSKRTKSRVIILPAIEEPTMVPKPA